MSTSYPAADATKLENLDTPYPGSGMPEIIFGSLFVVMTLFPGFKWRAGGLAKRKGPPLEPNSMGRMIFFILGVGLIVEGIHRIRHY
jgi:hypothetical protein